MLGEVGRYLGKVGDFIRLCPIGVYALAPQTETADSLVKTKQTSIENHDRFWRGPKRATACLLQVIVVYGDDLRRENYQRNDFSHIEAKTFAHRLSYSKEVLEVPFDNINDISETVSNYYEYDPATHTYKQVSKANSETTDDEVSDTEYSDSDFLPQSDWSNY